MALKQFYLLFLILELQMLCQKTSIKEHFYKIQKILLEIQIKIFSVFINYWNTKYPESV
jgi:hypothetical protein